jgi:hypothetical protein
MNCQSQTAESIGKMPAAETAVDQELRRFVHVAHDYPTFASVRC